MRKTMAGGYMSLIGTIWMLAAGMWANANLVTEAADKSFFLATLLAHPVALGIMAAGGLLLLIGLLLLVVECCQKGH